MNISDLKSFVDAGFNAILLAPQSVVEDSLPKIEPLRIDWSWLGLRSLENMTTEELWDYYHYNQRTRLAKTIKCIINGRQRSSRRKRLNLV